MPESATDDLYEQIDRLERSNRFWRLLALLSSVAALLLLLLIGALVVQLFLSDPGGRYRDELYQVQQMNIVEQQQREQDYERRLLDLTTELNETRQQKDELQRALNDAKRPAPPKPPEGRE